MRNRPFRSRAGRVVVALLVAGVASLTGIAPADAAPWGPSGADYNGVLCRLGATDVPMGSWTVNGTVPAFATADITGTGALQQPAPVSGTPSTMTPGQAGFSQADIGAVAYLLAQHQNGSAAELAEISTDVALVAGSGGTQSRCLGQNGTSASRAADRLDEARRFAGPYSVQVDAPSGAIPGSNADVTVTVRSASGAAAPGLPVSLQAGGSAVTAVTGRDGVARTTVAVPAAAVVVTASVQVPTALVYLDTSPPSVTLGPLTTVTGTGTLRPVLHPTPAVSVSAADLVLSGGTIRPVANVTGTFGYSGTGEISLLGPVRATGSCASVPAAALGAAAPAWQDTFTFRGDARYRARSSPGLGPGCYGVRATVTTTNSSPPERAKSAVAPLTVSTLRLTSAAAAAAGPPGGLAATVIGTDPGRASVTTTVTARGPLPVAKGACAADFSRAPTAGTSTVTALRRSGSQLRAVVTIPAIRTTGCYSLTTRSEATLDGDTATTGGEDAVTMAILKPDVVVTTDAVSSESGRPMPGTVQISGTDGFPGVVVVGVIAGSTVPISGCIDSAFPAGAKPAATTMVPTTADAAYRFRAPVPGRSACYALTATFTLTGNPAVTATSGTRDETTVFLAGIRPDAKPVTVVQTTSPDGVARAVITLLITTLLILAGCTTLFVRTFRRERMHDDPASGWPLPGDEQAPRPMPQ